jgi:hypothetical protein
MVSIVHLVIMINLEEKPSKYFNTITYLNLNNIL